MAIEFEKASLSVDRKDSDRDSKRLDVESSLQKVLDRLTKSSKPIGPRERMFFTERLSLLLGTDIPLHLALDSLAKQVSEGDMAALTESLNEEVKGGSTFARALASHPSVFPPTYVNLIAAAELGGFLPVALDRLRDMEERREELRSTLKSAMSYPAVLAFFSISVVIFVLVVVFPKFEEIFATIHDQLPITTRWLMATSDFLRRWWALILISMGVGLKLLANWVGRPEGVAALDRGMLAVPGLREIIIQLNVVQLLRVLGLSLEHGVGMVDALRSSRAAVSSAYFQRFIDRVETGISEGRGLRDGFNQEPLMPELVKQMVDSGEESGSLPIVMNRLADFYEREWRRALEMIAKIAEPAMLLIMGCVVGLIVSSLILPIFKLSRAVH